MRRIATILFAAAMLCAVPVFGQSFDIRTLDKLGANAKGTTNVTLTADVLKFAAAFLDADGDSDGAALKSLVGKLKAVYVRSYKYDRPGQYSEADLAPFRAMLSQPKWMAVVDAREGGETSQIYFLMAANGRLGGVAVLNLEPTKVSVVYIDGELEPRDIAKLSGNMGIPEIRHLDDMKKGR